MVKCQNRVNDPASNAPRLSGGNRTDSFTDAPGYRVHWEINREVHSMESTIKSGTWIGHLGRGLAPRELQFLLSVAQGFTAKQIARTFGVEPGTVVKRISSAMFKLGVHRQTALVAEAMRREIIVGMSEHPNPQGPAGESTDGVFIA